MSSSSADHLLRTLGIGLLTAAMGGCSFIRPFVDANRELSGTKPGQMAQSEDAPELTVETAPWVDEVFRVRPLQTGHALPNRRIDKLSVTEAGLYDVIQLLFENTQLAVTFEGGTDNMRRYGPVTAYNLSGNLNDVMERLGSAIGFFWSVNNDTVTIEPEQQFIIELPPVLNDDNLAGISNTLQYLGVRDSYLDRNERRLVFRCNRKALQSVQAYMQKLRETRSMIIYDAQILQVDLRDSEKMGIQWSKYAKTGSGTSTSSTSDTTGTGTNTSSAAASGSSVIPSTGNTGFDITLVGRSFSGQTLIEFLRTQGTVKNLSKPRIGVMSGTRGSLRVGNNTTIVSKVGRDLTNTVSQTTVETKDVKTGLELNLFGEEHDRTVYTRIALSVTELLDLTTFEALGTKLSLPKIADRELRTQIRSRPGDTIILGGITINRAEAESAKGISILSRRSENNVSELVVVLRPRLVIFRPALKTTVMPVDSGTIIPLGTRLNPPPALISPTVPTASDTSPANDAAADLKEPQAAQSLAQNKATNNQPHTGQRAVDPTQDTTAVESAISRPIDMPPTGLAPSASDGAPAQEAGNRQSISAQAQTQPVFRIPDMRFTTPGRLPMDWRL